ncbi:MAG: 6-phosphogluconolactonase [archaeon]
MATLISEPDRGKLERKAVKIITSAVERAVVDHGHAVLGVPGGTSVRGLFGKLCGDASIPWDKVHVFMVDERLVALDDADSNFRQVKELLLDHLISSGKLPEKNVHPFTFAKGRVKAGLIRYYKQLCKLGGRFDAMVLGCGPDGHVAALFPGHESIKDLSEGFISFKDSPKPPSGRMSASKKLIQETGTIVLMLLGEAKKEALVRYLDDRILVSGCPAKLVESVADSFLLTDLVPYPTINLGDGE